jgi:hypothetical protein
MGVKQQKGVLLHSTGAGIVFCQPSHSHYHPAVGWLKLFLLFLPKEGEKAGRNEGRGMGGDDGGDQTKWANGGGGKEEPSSVSFSC